MNQYTNSNTYNGTSSRIFARFVGPDIDVNGQSVPLTTDFKRLKMLNTLSISSTVTATQIRTGGNDAPVAVVKGFRTIAGTFVFVDGFIDTFGPLMEEYIDLVETNQQKLDTSYYEDRTDVVKSIDPLNPRKGIIQDIHSYNSFWYDIFPNIELLIITKDPFTGDIKAIAINDIKIRDVGTTISIHDLYTEKTMTYVATNIVTTLLPSGASNFDLDSVAKIYSKLIVKAGGGPEISNFCNDLTTKTPEGNVHQIIRDMAKLGRIK